MSRRHREALSRFSQAGGGPGSGLGLAIAVRVMKNHGGQLSILLSSRGATIKLRMPLLEI
jgi:two-component system sensor histidine kinase TctE